MRLHDKYGTNPTIPLCWLCLRAKNELVLLGASCEGEAPHEMLIRGDLEPCAGCKEAMNLGVILVSVRDGEEDEGNRLERPDPGKPYRTPNPYRTGGWCVVKLEAVEKMFTALLKPEGLAGTLELIGRRRWVFLPDRLWDHVGLPRGEAEGVAGSLEEYKRKQEGGGDAEASQE